MDFLWETRERVGALVPVGPFSLWQRRIPEKQCALPSLHWVVCFGKVLTATWNPELEK